MLDTPDANGTGMPSRPKPLQRLALLLLALGLPALMLVVTAGSFFALTSLGNHDRALTWVQGTPVQLQSLERAIAGHPVFRHGRLEPGAFERHRPAPCTPDLVSVSFSRLHNYELLVAKATLDQLVRESGAAPCPAHAFVFNDLPNPLDPTEWDESVAAMLLMLLIPVGSLLAAYWACSGQFGLPALLAGPGPASRWLPWVAAVVGLAMAWGLMLGGLRTWLGAPPADLAPMPSFSPGMLLIAALYAPFLEETAFRGWLVPIAERAIGTTGACALSALAYACVHLPAGGYQALASLGPGTLLAVLFARTRCLPACLVAHGACNAAHLAWPALAGG